MALGQKNAVQTVVSDSTRATIMHAKVTVEGYQHHSQNVGRVTGSINQGKTRLVEPF